MLKTCSSAVQAIPDSQGRMLHYNGVEFSTIVSSCVEATGPSRLQLSC